MIPMAWNFIDNGYIRLSRLAVMRKSQSILPPEKLDRIFNRGHHIWWLIPRSGLHLDKSSGRLSKPEKFEFMASENP
jgi:hypothetical protein